LKEELAAGCRADSIAALRRAEIQGSFRPGNRYGLMFLNIFRRGLRFEEILAKRFSE